MNQPQNTMRNYGSNRRKGLYWLAAVLLVVLVAGGIILYMFLRSNAQETSTNGTNTDQQQSTNQGQQQTPNTNGNTAPENTTYPVSVYFSRHPESDDDPSQTFRVSRTSPDSGVGKFAVSELIRGPTQTEQNRGYFTQVKLLDSASTCGGDDFKLTIENGTATLQFCRQFDHVGSVSDGQAESSINATLKQFSTVQKVVILNSSGDCEFNLSGQNLCKE